MPQVGEQHDEFISGARGRYLGRAAPVLIDVQPAGGHVLTERGESFLAFGVTDSKIQ